MFESRPMDRAVVVFAAIAIAVGVFFRADVLDRPLFWQDENATALRATGHTATSYRALFDGKVHSLAQIAAFERLDASKSVLDVATTMAREDAQHAPVYYMLERLWIGAFGTSVVGFRGLSVLLGILGVVFVFFLARAISGSPGAGCIAASLYALSPLMILASRQAREYALFVDVTFLATYALLVALNARGAGAWTLYALAVVLGAYSDTLFVLVVAGHGLATVALRGVLTRSSAAWLGSTLLAYLTFAPWALAMVQTSGHVASEEAWIKTPDSLRTAAAKWAFNIAAVAFDGEYASLRLALFAVAGLLVILAAVIWAMRSGTARERVVPVALALPTIVVLIVADALEHAHFATVARYLEAVWIAILLAAAFGIAHALATRRTRALAFTGWMALLALGVAAGLVRLPKEIWWDDADPIAFQTVARSINEHPAPLVVSEDHWNVPLELGRYLRPDAQILLFGGPPGTVPAQDAFVIAPSPEFIARLQGPGSDFETLNESPPSPKNAIAKHPSLDDERSSNALWALRPRRKRR